MQKCNLCDKIKTGRVSAVFLEVDMYIFTLCHTVHIYVHEYVRTYVQMSRVHLLQLRISNGEIDITRNTNICIQYVCTYFENSSPTLSSTSLNICVSVGSTLVAFTTYGDLAGQLHKQPK